MGIITNAVASALGLSSSGGWDWRDHIHQASFRGVPFAVVSGEGMFGRRVAIHEYPYRDTVWVEDLGRSARRFTLRGFLVHDSRIYSAGDVFAQRDALVAACETGESGLLVHPTLGELSVYVPDGGLRIEEGVESERVFVFTLAFMESGDKAFSIVTGTTSTSLENWYKTLTTMTSVTLATVTGEMNSITGAVKTIKSTVSAWDMVFWRAVNSVTDMTSTVTSLFSPDSYSRYCTGGNNRTSQGATSSTLSSLNTWLDTADADDDTVMDTIIACSVTDRAATESAIASLENITSPETAVKAIQNVITSLAGATGSDVEKIRVMADIASTEDTAYHDSAAEKAVALATQLYIRTLAAGAMLWRLMQYIPRSLTDAQGLLEEARRVTDTVLLALADQGNDDGYDVLNTQYTQFVTDWQSKYLSLSSWMTVTIPVPLPSLLLANRLYQDVSREAELVSAASPVHPAFMPVTFTAKNA